MTSDSPLTALTRDALLPKLLVGELPALQPEQTVEVIP